MRRRLAILAAMTAPIVAAAGCGYPAFTFNGHDSGTGAVSGSSTSASGAGGAATTSSSSSSAGASSGGAGCMIGHLLISEIRTHGPGGAADEFVELYNATSQSVLLDSLWSLEGRAVDPPVTSYTARWKGKGGTIPAYGHYLIAGSSGSYTGPPGDDKLSTGITDGASLRLLHNGSPVDAICYYHANNFGMAGSFLDVFNPYTCEGLPAPNPHDGTSGTDTDVSLERPPGGTLGNCTDTNHNDTDFKMQSPSTPLGKSDAPTP